MFDGRFPQWFRVAAFNFFHSQIVIRAVLTRDKVCIRSQNAYQCCLQPISFILAQFMSDYLNGRWRTSGLANLTDSFDSRIWFILWFPFHRCRCVSKASLAFPFTDVKDSSWVGCAFAWVNQRIDITTAAR
jgi:hypothetical protein